LKTSKNPLKKNLKRFYTPNIGDPIFWIYYVAKPSDLNTLI
jgi:hypothetical protein